MTDKEILDEVYSRLREEKRKYDSQIQGWLFGDPLINFIETEWQKADEKKRKENEKDSNYVI